MLRRKGKAIAKKWDNDMDIWKILQLTMAIAMIVLLISVFVIWHNLGELWVLYGEIAQQLLTIFLNELGPGVEA